MEGESEGAFSSAEAPSVLPIDRKTVHQICSGQVVLNLATAIKELLENSLDAGSTSVDIKLRENGAELVEVSDNGFGVEPQNFEALTLKHHTSKLRDFSDLSSVETFGFRGEALSSLCALSNLTITTRHKSQVAGTKLIYDHNGKLVSQIACARQQGTTVTLANLFSTLPVRHKEFLHNTKKELVKLVHVLHGYCIISNGVRIVCTNQMEKGRKNTIVSTLGSDQIRDNVTCVFGPKQIQSLMPFKQIKPSEEECNEYNIKIKEDQCNLFQVTGFISKVDHGMGRSAADRQFFYINKRPCDLMKVSRVVNEVYHMYNRHQYPFVMLDISLQRDTVDVNVTPDKRTVFMQEEKLLLAIIKCSLKAMFDPGTSNYEVNQKPLNQLSFAAITNQERKSDNKLEEKANKTQDFSGKAFPSLSSFKRSYSDMTGKEEKKTQPKAKQSKLINFCSTVKDSGSHNQLGKAKLVLANDINNRKETPGVHDQSLETIVICDDSEGIEIEKEKSVHPEAPEEFDVNTNSRESEFSGESASMEKEVEVLEYKSNTTASETKEKLSRESDKVEADVKILEYKTNDCPKAISCKTKESETINKTKKGLHTIVKQRKSMNVNFNLKTLKECIDIRKNGEKQELKSRLFRAKISPDSNAAAEEELTRNIDKESFSKMKILGQFNLGFILTRLDDDLFIIDQHASDEKYNFEYQQKNTSLQSQRLIVPKKLELTAVNESVLIDNIEIFRKNGFEFQINESAQTTQKVQLISLPVSKNWTFEVEDVEELIFMLSDSPGVMCRPTRVRKMFASRACRMSTMVGTALSREEMKTIVNHMGQMNHPWNCPHGRPTMRHVINLNMLPGGGQDCF